MKGANNSARHSRAPVVCNLLSHINGRMTGTNPQGLGCDHRGGNTSEVSGECRVRVNSSRIESVLDKQCSSVIKSVERIDLGLIITEVDFIADRFEVL